MVGIQRSPPYLDICINWQIIMATIETALSRPLKWGTLGLFSTSQSEVSLCSSSLVLCHSFSSWLCTSRLSRCVCFHVCTYVKIGPDAQSLNDMIVVTFSLTRKYPLRRYILGSGAPGTTVSFFFNFSSLKKLVKWSWYEIQSFTTNFGEKLVFYKSF